jgi:hypothetical protein
MNTILTKIAQITEMLKLRSVHSLVTSFTFFMPCQYIHTGKADEKDTFFKLFKFTINAR